MPKYCSKNDFQRMKSHFLKWNRIRWHQRPMKSAQQWASKWALTVRGTKILIIWQYYAKIPRFFLHCQQFTLASHPSYGKNQAEYSYHNYLPMLIAHGYAGTLRVVNMDTALSRVPQFQFHRHEQSISHFDEDAPKPNTTTIYTYFCTFQCRLSCTSMQIESKFLELCWNTRFH